MMCKQFGPYKEGKERPVPKENLTLQEATLLRRRDNAVEKGCAEGLRGVARNIFATTVAQAETVTLSVEESRLFLATLDEPFRPNKRLAEALELASQAAIR